MEQELKSKNLPKSKSADQALQSLKRICSRAERSSGDALRLMQRWGVDREQAYGVLHQLIKERYIDDRRYAEAFIKDKSSFSKWGYYKIVKALQAKGISKEIIDSVIADRLDDVMESDRLERLLILKRRQIKDSDPYKIKSRLVRYGIGAGWPMSSVVEIVEKMIKDDD